MAPPHHARPRRAGARSGTIQATFEQRRFRASNALPSRIAEASERLVNSADWIGQPPTRRHRELYPQMLTSRKTIPNSSRTPGDGGVRHRSGEAGGRTDRALAEEARLTAHRALMMAKHQTDTIFSAKSDLDAIRDRLSNRLYFRRPCRRHESEEPEPVFDPLSFADDTAIAERPGRPHGQRRPAGALSCVPPKSTRRLPCARSVKTPRRHARTRPGSDLPGQKPPSSRQTLRADRRGAMESACARRFTASGP